MHRYRTHAILAFTVVFSTARVAQAGAIFSWNPRAVGLNGSKFSADSLVLGDHSHIIIRNDGTLTDTGYLPVERFSLGGAVVSPPGLQQRSKRLGAFVRYTASGTLTYSQGFPNTATYQQLNYQIVGYNGAASFTFDPQTRDAILGGPITQLTTLEAGSLIAGQLQFSPTDLSISGSVSTTITEVLPQFVVGPLAGFDFTVSHPPTSYRFLPSSDPSSIASEVQVDAQSGTTGSLRSGQGSTVGVGTVSAAALTAPESPGSVPEPASMKVFGFAAAALALTRRFIGPDLARGDTPRDLMRA